MLIKARHQPHVLKHGSRWIAFVSRAVDVGSDMGDERPAIEPSDGFEWNVFSIHPHSIAKSGDRDDASALLCRMPPAACAGGVASNSA